MKRDPNAPLSEKKDKAWMFKPPRPNWTPPVEPRPDPYVHAISPAVAVQVRRNTASEFPCCPTEITESSLADYAVKLKPGVEFCRNALWTSIVNNCRGLSGMDRTQSMTTAEFTDGKEAVDGR